MPTRQRPSKTEPGMVDSPPTGCVAIRTMASGQPSGYATKSEGDCGECVTMPAPVSRGSLSWLPGFLIIPNYTEVRGSCGREQLPGWL